MPYNTDYPNTSNPGTGTRPYNLCPLSDSQLIFDLGNLIIVTKQCTSTMSFWALNKKKIILLVTFWFLAGFCLGLLRGDKYALARSIIGGTMALVVAVPYELIKGLRFHKAMQNVIDAPPQLSIAPLFDDGYTISLCNERDWFEFTTQSLAGTISQQQVTVYIYKPHYSKQLALMFSFDWLYPPDGGEYERDIDFGLDRHNRLTKDVKPEVLDFARYVQSNEVEPISI
jgi:hypothetical protein